MLWVVVVGWMVVRVARQALSDAQPEAVLQGPPPPTLVFKTLKSTKPKSPSTSASGGSGGSAEGSKPLEDSKAGAQDGDEETTEAADDNKAAEEEVEEPGLVEIKSDVLVCSRCNVRVHWRCYRSNFITTQVGFWGWNCVTSRGTISVVAECFEIVHEAVDIRW